MLFDRVLKLQTGHGITYDTNCMTYRYSILKFQSQSFVFQCFLKRAAPFSWSPPPRRNPRRQDLYDHCGVSIWESPFCLVFAGKAWRERTFGAGLASSECKTGVPLLLAIISLYSLCCFIIGLCCGKLS